MSEPIAPPPPPLSTAEPAQPVSLPPNLAACLACVFPLVGGLVLLNLEKRNTFVRFYAMQSIYFGGASVVLMVAYSIVSFVLAAIPVIGWLLLPVMYLIGVALSVAWLVIYVVLIVKSIVGSEWEIPLVGPLARRQVMEKVS